MRQEKATKSILSKIAESASVQIVNLIVGIILARLLSPTDYGIYTILLIFVNIGLTVVQGGFNSALIQRKDTTKEDYSTVFSFSLFAALIIYLLLFFTAPLIATIYKQPNVAQPLRVMTLALFPNALFSVVNARVAREMDFPFLAKLSVICVTTVGLIAIGLAYSGVGVWALVTQQILTYTILPVSYCILRRWSPGIRFYKNRFRPLFSFSSKILLTDLINAVYLEIQGIIIGIKYNAEALAFFSRGQVFPRSIMSTINSSVQTVLFPVYSDLQDDKQKMGNSLLSNMRIITFIVYPMMIGLFAVSDSLVRLLLTEKWIGCIHFLRIYCIAYLFWPIDSINLQGLKATGKGNTYLLANTLKKIIAAAILLLFVFITDSVETFAYSGIAIYISDIIIGATAMKKEVGVTLFQEIQTIMLNLICSASIFLVMLIPNLLNNYVLTLVIQVVAGVCIYVVFSFVLNRNCMLNTLDIFRKLTKRKAVNQ